MKNQSFLNNDSDVSQKNFYFFRIVPTKLLIHKSVLKMVHPLTRFKFSLQKNLNKCDEMKQWVYAGTHNGIIDIDDQKFSFEIQQTQRVILCSLKLHQLKYNNQDKQQIVGKHNLLITNYIKRFRQQNKSFSQEKAQISPDFILCYDIYLEQTREGLQVLANQHQRQMKEKGVRARKVTQIQSNISSTFSESFNQIQVKGENRILNYNKIVRKNQKGSERKILGFQEEAMNKFLYTTQKINKKVQKIQTLQSPTILQSLQMKHLTSQDVNEILDNSKQVNLFKKSSGNIQDTNNQKRKKIMEDFELKKQQFKLKLMETKKESYQLPRPSSQRLFTSNLSGTSQIRVTVKLSESLRLPRKSPWQKVQQQRKKTRNKWITIIILAILFIVLFQMMHPTKKIESTKKSKKHFSYG